MNDLCFTINTAVEEEIYLHLMACNNDFFPPLEDRVDIRSYSRKLFDLSTRFEAWENTVLVGLIATYFAGVEKPAFITNVSVIKSYTGAGIATRLLSTCIEQARLKNIRELRLEVNRNNFQAVRLYNKFNFTCSDVHGDILSMNLHLRPDPEMTK